MSNFDLDIYLDSTKLIKETFMKEKSLKESLNLFSFWEKDIFSYVQEYREKFTKECVSSLLVFNTHSFYLSAINLTLSGQASSVYPLLRVAYESATYALMIHDNIELAEAWSNRNTNEELNKKNRTVFSPAIKKLKNKLEEYDKNSNGGNYADYVIDLYDASIDYGAHPNPITIFNNSKIFLERGNLIHRFEYLSNFESEMVRAISACFDYGIVISIILSLKDMNIESFCLDDKYLELFKKNTDVIEMLIGEPLKHKKYKRFND